MNIDDCSEEYETLGENVFGHRRWFHVRTPLFFWIRDKYNLEVLEQVVKDIDRDRVPKNVDSPRDHYFCVR